MPDYNIPDKQLDIEDIVRPKITMLYGPPGSGKTPAAATWPAPQRWIDLDLGMDSIMWAMRAGVVKHKISDFVTATPEDEVDSQGKLKSAVGWWQMLAKLNEWLEHMDEWQTLVIDPITTVNMLAMSTGMEVSGRYPSVQKPFSTSGKMSKEAGIMMIQIQDYKPAQSYIRQLFTQLKEIAKIHRKWVVVVAHEYEVTKSSSDIGGVPVVVRVEPQLFGQQRKDIVKDIDEVYYLRQEGTKVDPKFIAQTRGDGFTIARSRFGCLDTKLDWTMKPLFPMVKEAVEKFYGLELK